MEYDFEFWAALCVVVFIVAPLCIWLGSLAGKDYVYKRCVQTGAGQWIVNEHGNYQFEFNQQPE